MSSTSLYEATPQTGTVSSTNLTSLYSNTGNFTTGNVSTTVYSVNGGIGVSVSPTTGNVFVNIGQDVSPASNVTFANVTATGNLSNNYFTLANSAGSAGQVLTTNGLGSTSWTALSGVSVTSITGTANQVLVSSPTGAVTLSLPQDIATTSNPTFAGVVAGLVNIGVSPVPNNVIRTTAGSAADLVLIADSGTIYLSSNVNAGSNSLYVDATNKRVGVNTTTPAHELTISDGGDGYVQLGMINNERLWLVTNNVGDNLISYAVKETAGSIINRLQFDATGGDQWFNTGKLGVNNAAPAYTLDVNGNSYFSQGVKLNGVFQINGDTSGYSTFVAPTTGSNLNYKLPGTAGAANTVLTNDGVGNLSWALPGGGGSTFGNITVGVATDNTISTTTGNLVLASATNLLDASTLGADFEYVTVDNQATLDSSTLTTTSTATVALNLTARNAMTGLINIIQGTNVHCLNYTALRTGASTALLTTFGEMYNTTSLASFTADVSGGNLRLLVTPTSATSTVFSAVRTALT